MGGSVLEAFDYNDRRNKVPDKQQVANISAMVNGERRELQAGVTILGLLGMLGIQPDRVAVEHDREIVKPSAWDTTVVRDGSEIEIVHFVGGG